MTLYEYSCGNDLTCNSCGDVLEYNSRIGCQLVTELIEYVIENEGTS